MTETQHVIALNPYRKGNKGKVFSNSMAVYDKVIASPEIRKMIQQIRGELPIPKVNANDAEAVKKAQDRLKRRALKKSPFLRTKTEKGYDL